MQWFSQGTPVSSTNKTCDKSTCMSIFQKFPLSLGIVIFHQNWRIHQILKFLKIVIKKEAFEIDTKSGSLRNHHTDKQFYSGAAKFEEV
jgi:hypothetical protein